MNGEAFKNLDISVNYYELLEVAQDADLKAIRKAYRQKSLLLHPDKNPDDASAPIRFHQLNLAYQLLCNVDAKQAYDSVLLQRQAKTLRDEKVSAHKRKMRDELEEREKLAEESRNQRARTQTAARNRASEIERLRYENEKKLREDTADLHRRVRAVHKFSSANTASSLGGRTVKFKWRHKRITLDNESLRVLLEQCRASMGFESTQAVIENVLVAPAKPGKKFGSAIVQYSCADMASKLVHAVTAKACSLLNVFEEATIVDNKETEECRPPPIFPDPVGDSTTKILSMEDEILRMMQNKPQ